MKITAKQYARALFEALKEAPDNEGKIIDNFFETLKKNNDLRQATEIMSYFEEYDREEKNLVEVLIVSVSPLEEDMKNKIRNKMGSLLGKQIVLKEKIDAGILGGLVIKFKDYVFDASIKSRIEEMGKTLVSER